MISPSAVSAATAAQRMMEQWRVTETTNQLGNHQVHADLHLLGIGDSIGLHQGVLADLETVGDTPDTVTTLDDVALSGSSSGSRGSSRTVVRTHELGTRGVTHIHVVH